MTNAILWSILFQKLKRISLQGWTILAKRCVLASIFELFSTEEDCFELLEVKHTISSSIVLGDHIVYLLTVNLLAELLHGQANIFFGDLAR